MLILFIISIVLSLAGLLFLSEATTGIGLIELACLFGIFARITQAASNNNKIIKLIENSLIEAENEK